MSIIIDEFISEQSISKRISSIAEAIRLDLTLSRNPNINSGTITGIVRDLNGNPISDAVVIILDGTYALISNTISENDGRYSFPLIPSGTTYKAYAQSPGFLLGDAIPFCLGINQRMEIDFTLVSDEADTLSIIAGEVLNAHGLPIKSASAELYQVSQNVTKLLVLTFSDDIGKFTFRDIGLGSYFIKINASGYFSEYYPVEIKNHKSICQVNSVLKENLKSSKGIIFGTISDNDEMPLANSDVILYRVGADKSLVPVSYTRTNHEGIYMFLNVPQGEYLVNSNRSIIVD